MQYSDELLSAINHYLDGRATPAEKQLLSAWYHSFDDAAVHVDVNFMDGLNNDADYRNLIEARLKLKIYESIGIDKGLEVEESGGIDKGRVIAKGLEVEERGGIDKGRAIAKGLEVEEPAADEAGLWPRLAGFSTAWKIAAAVAVMTLGIWLFYASGILGGRHLEGSNATRDLSTNDIAPGRNTATITFDDGEVIALNDEELSISSESGSRRGAPEASSEKTQFLASRISRSKTIVLSTPRGGTYQVTLPDGSKVWLNADTKISFPSQFIERQRKVLLVSGEAYFEVSKNKAKPFIVESRGQEVTVLGTQFNINAYPDEGSTKTTLLEGSVSVSSLRGLGSASRSNLPGRGPSTTRRAATILIPNQQAVLTATNTIQIKQISPAEAIAWKNGEFIFNDEPLESIMLKLSRWYDVDVVYKDIDPKASFYGSMSRYDQISKVLSKLELTGGIHFKIEGRKIIVTK